MEELRSNVQGPEPDVTYPMPKVGHDICFLKNVITNPNIQVGDYTYYHDYKEADRFEKENVIYHEEFLNDKLIIGKFTQIAMDVRFIMNASTHQMDGFSTFPFAVFSEKWAERYNVNFPYHGDTVVGNDVWIGYNAIIMPGLKVGNGAIIAARSIVTKDVPPYTVVGGNPARTIRTRFDEETIESLERVQWWDWPMDKILAHLPAITGNNIEELLNVK